jgi:hypothetical protein
MRSILHTKLFFFLVISLVLITPQCVRHPALVTGSSTIKNILLPVCSEKRPAFKGMADIRVLRNGETIKLKMSISYQGDSAILCDFHSPFGGTLASLEVDGSGGIITIESRQIQVDLNQKISEFPYFPTIPFTFYDFIRIITGMLPGEACSAKDSDTVVTSGSNAIFKLQSRMGIIETLVNRQDGSIKSIQIKPESPASWRLELSQIKDGFARQIVMIADSANSVEINYEKILETL